MLTAKDDIKEWYNDLTEDKKLLLWQKFSSFLSSKEIRLCMSEVTKGGRDLFDIHYEYGLIHKYQIYFNQVIRNLNDM